MADSTTAAVHRLSTVSTRYSTRSQVSSTSKMLLRNNKSRPTTRSSSQKQQQQHNNQNVNVKKTGIKRKRSSRYDSSESSDSGVASLTCSEASPWSSSGSDLTELPTSPVSPQPSIIEEEPQTRPRSHSESLSSPEDDCSCDKRPRRVSSESSTTGSRFSLSSLTANFKWLSYLWRSNKEPAKEVLPAHPIRFPVDNHPKTIIERSSPMITASCLWVDCNAALSSDQSLLEHILSVHVRSSSGGQLYACQWRGCKVQGRKSSSRNWLERHVLLHGEPKPFRCIVESCEQRFHSQPALQRHVNAHLKSGSHPSPVKAPTAAPPTAPKINRRSYKKARHARPNITKVNPARLIDYFDADVMERLRHQLVVSYSSQNFKGFHNQIVARRCDPNGKSRILLRWTSDKQWPDQWVLESQKKSPLVAPIVTVSRVKQRRK